WRHRAGFARIAIPHIERRSGDRMPRESFVERILVNDFRSRHVDQEGRRFHQAEPSAIDRSDRLTANRHRDQHVIRAAQHLIDRLWPPEEGRVVFGRAPHSVAYRLDVHVESAGPAGDRLTNAPITKYPDRLAGEFRPDRRRVDAHSPLALPLA